MSHTNPPSVQGTAVPILLSVIAGSLLLFLVLAEFLAPYTPADTSPQDRYVSPLKVSLLDQTANGVRLRPHIDGVPIRQIDPDTLRRTTVGMNEEKVYLGLFVEGAPVRLLGMVEGERHLFGPKDKTQPAYLLGTDRLGCDLLSLYIYSARNSLYLWLVIVVVTVGIATLLGWLLARYSVTLNRSVGKLHLLHYLPTLLFRGLFIVLIFWWWPYAKLLTAVMLGRVDGAPPTASIAWILMLLAGSVILLALLLHRRLLIWLLAVWISLYFLNPFRWLILGMRWTDGTAADSMYSALTALRALPDAEFAILLILMMAGPLLIVLAPAAYLTCLRRQSAVTATDVGAPNAPPVLWLLASTTVYSLAAMPLLILPEVDLVRYGYSGSIWGHLMLGYMFTDISHLQSWITVPWMLTSLFVPMLVLLLVELTLNPLFSDTSTS